MPLTNLTITNAKAKNKDYKISDGKGLYLLVKKNGSKLWRQKYRYLGKERTYSIGIYPDVSLKEARERRDEARKLLSKGLDPSTEKQARKAAKQGHQTRSFHLNRTMRST